MSSARANARPGRPAHDIERIRARTRRDDGEAVTLEVETDGVTDLLLVVDDENGPAYGPILVEARHGP